MDSETKAVYEELKKYDTGPASASGIPEKYSFNWEFLQTCVSDGQTCLYLPLGGCIVLKPDGTWSGDIAPFSD